MPNKKYHTPDINHVILKRDILTDVKRHMHLNPH
jgi:hypothetical protein